MQKKEGFSCDEQILREEKEGYFCRFDELTDVVACPGIQLLPFDEFRYVDRETIFGPAKD